MHYAALRLSMKDFKKNLSRERINTLTKRMPPKTWMKYSSASLVIKILRDATPTSIHDKIMQNAYRENRKPLFIYTFDSSHNKHGKKGFHNWINFVLKQIKFPWYGLVNPISDNLLRIRLKDNFGYWCFNFWHILII